MLYKVVFETIFFLRNVRVAYDVRVYIKRRRFLKEFFFLNVRWRFNLI